MDEEPDDFAALVAAFLRLGVDEIAALKLAEQGASPSAVRELIAKGATADEAARIAL